MPEPTQVLIIRHGQSTWNADGRWQGHADPPLSGEGIMQAREAAPRLGTFDAVFASDLQRARHTADLLSAELGIGPVIVEPLLRERAAGEWTGLTRMEIEEGWPGALASGGRPEGYEGDAEVFQRGIAALALAHRLTSGGTVLAVSHGGLIRALERFLGNDGGLIPNLGGRWIFITDERATLGDRVTLVDPAPLPAPEAL